MHIERKPRGRPRTRANTEEIRIKREMSAAKYYVDDRRSWAMVTLSNIRKTAKRANMRCDLTNRDVIDLQNRSELCPLTGIKLNFARGRGTRLPDSACLVMIDPAGPMTKSNMQIVAWEGKRQTYQPIRTSALTLASIDLVTQMKGKIREAHELREQLQHHERICDTLSNSLTATDQDIQRLHQQFMDDLYEQATSP